MKRIERSVVSCALQDAGLLVISDLTIETRRCLERTDYMMMRKGGVDYEGKTSTSSTAAPMSRADVLFCVRPRAVYEAVHYEDVVMAVPLVMMAYEQNEGSFLSRPLF